MKKHLLLLCSAVFLLFFFCSSQVISKKDKLFGASALISFYNNNQPPGNMYSQQYSNVALIPSYGWAIKENTVIGIKANLSYGRSDYETALQKQKSYTLQVAPEFYFRKYKLLKDRFGLFFNHGIFGSYTRQKSEIVGQSVSKTKAWGGGYSFTPGAFYKFSDRFLGEANIGGLYGEYYYNNGAKIWSAGASFLRYFNVGIQYVIPGKKA
jgi:hypothetical protein